MTPALTLGHKPLIGWLCHGISTGFRPISRGINAKEAMMKRPFKRLTLTLAALLLAAPVYALDPLPQEKFINDSLRAGRVGDVIRKTCPSISARMFVVWQKLEDLKAYALDQGYTADEVEAFIKNDDEKTRLKAEAAAYLKAAGAVEGDAESYCKVGRDEIAKGSAIGELLRSSQ